MAGNPVKEPNGSDAILRETLRKAYLARAKLFVEKLRTRKGAIDALVEYLSNEDAKDVSWQLASLGISESALKKVKKAGIAPHLVFCHPKVLAKNSKTILYYRNLAALSQKGLNQLLAGVHASERETERCKVVNSIVSAVVDDMATFDLAVARAVIPAEFGTEIQGTWVNIIGRGAAKRVEKLIKDYVDEHHLAKETQTTTVLVDGKNKKQVSFRLHNGWTIIFGDEPDVSIIDNKDMLRSVIEIKGSMDRAGAQTRYGEAKKSFAKALAQNGQCETIYLASCYTKAVVSQIKLDAQVRKRFNLIDVFEDADRRKEFLEELFTHIIRIKAT